MITVARALTAAAVAEERAKRDMSRRELASRVGVTEAYIGMIERGDRRPTGDLLTRIAAVLDISMDDLVGLKPLTLFHIGDYVVDGSLPHLLGKILTGPNPRGQRRRWREWEVVWVGHMHGNAPFPASIGWVDEEEIEKADDLCLACVDLLKRINS